MKTIKLDQSGCVSFYIDGMINWLLVLPFFKNLVDILVDYCRHLLLKDKMLHCPVCLAVYCVKNGKKPRLFGSPVQSYICRNCGKQFCENIFHRFYRYKYPVYVILLTLNKKCLGNAIAQIARSIHVPNLSQVFQPCYATITRWIKKFGQTLIEQTAKIQLKAGSRRHWEIDEQYDSRIIETDEQNKYVLHNKKKAGSFGIIDPHTKLISIESFDFDLKRIAKSSILRTMYKWNSKPKSIWTDGFQGYETILASLEIRQGVVIHSKQWKNKKGHHNNNIEREWVEKVDWIKHCRGFATMTGRTFYDKLYEMQRNFFTPRRVLGGLTPAQKAGMKQQTTLLSLLL